MKDAKLTVLIPTHGRPTLLGRTLASLGACRLPEGYAETVVVENGLQAGSEAVVAAAAAAHPHLRLRYLHVERANKSHALNEALATVGEGLVVFFDDDVRLEPGVLEAYAEAASQRPERAFFGGPVQSDFEVQPPDWVLSILPPSVSGFTLADAASRRFYLGANWAAYAHDIARVGGFSLHHGPGAPSGARGQESEAQARLLKGGVDMVGVPTAQVWHYVPAERCTFRWGLYRAYNSGKGQRVQEGPPQIEVRLLRNVKQLISHALRSLGNGARGDRTAAAAQACGVAYQLGYVRSSVF